MGARGMQAVGFAATGAEKTHLARGAFQIVVPNIHGTNILSHLITKENLIETIVEDVTEVKFLGVE